MATAVTIPTLGLAIEEATLVEWLKKEGDKVEKDENLATVVTDKVTFEVTAPEAGVLLKTLYKENTVVPVNKTVAIIGEEGEDISDLLEGKQETDEEVKEEVKQEQKQAPIQPEKKRKVSPLAKRLAKEHGIDLSEIEGSGPDGSIRKEDIMAYIEAKSEEKPKSEVKPEPADLEEEIIPMVGIRKAIAENMVRSKHTAPHVTTVAEVDMTEIVNLRKELRKLEGMEKLSFLPFIVKAATAAIKEFPIINSTLKDNNIIIKKYVNMGIAVAGKDGLVVPVIKQAQQKSFLDIVKEMEELTVKAREGSLTMDMLQGGTFTISNAGTFGAVIATPIINQPQSAILWMGTITKKPVVYQDEITVRSMMYITLSYDHRVMDGATAAQYLQAVRKLLESPLMILMQ